MEGAAWALPLSCREVADHGVGVFQGFQRGVGAMIDEFLAGEVAGGDGEAAGADGMGTADVFGCVADDPGLRGGEGFSAVVACAFESDGSEGVAVVVIAAVGAKGEVAAEPEVVHFGSGAACRVAGEQTECDGFRLVELVDQFQRSGECAAGKGAGLQVFLELSFVESEIFSDAFRRGFDAEVAVNAVDDAEVGRAGQIE